MNLKLSHTLFLLVAVPLFFELLFVGTLYFMLDQVEQERAGAPAGLADDLMLDLIQEAGRTRATVAWLALERGNKN